MTFVAAIYKLSQFLSSETRKMFYLQYILSIQGGEN
jgi:hypothetical protein